MPLTDMQLAYLGQCNHRWNVKTGATGSGKSFLDYAVVIPQRILACRNEGHIILLGNTQGTLERNILEPMRDLWPGCVGQIRDGNKVNLFGKTAYALGADSKKHIARIQGATVEYAYGDEVTTWAQGVFEMLKSRLRCDHSHFDGTCNPDNPHHWFKAFLDSDADVYKQAYTIDDNPYLPAEFVKQLKLEYAGTVYYQRYILGLWAVADGSVYRQFADDPTRYYDTDRKLTIATIGVDFGGNLSGHAFSLTGFEEGFRGLLLLDEWYHKGEITPTELETAFVEFVRSSTDRLNGVPLVAAYCDSAETTLIQGLRAASAKAGFPISVVKAAKKPINDRIRFLCRMMASGRYHIAEHCKHTIAALQSAVWDSKKVTADVRLDDGSTNIDSLDAQEYSYEAYMNDMTQMEALH